MDQGVHITVFNTGWVKADNRVLLSGAESFGHPRVSWCKPGCDHRPHPLPGRMAGIAGQRYGICES